MILSADGGDALRRQLHQRRGRALPARHGAGEPDLRQADLPGRRRRQRAGRPGINGLDGAASLRLSPNGNHLYVAGSVDKAVAVFSRDGGTGALTFVEAKFDGQAGVNGLDGVNGVAVSVDGTERLRHRRRGGRARRVRPATTSTGAITFRNMLVDGVNGIDGLDGVSSVQVSFDGRYVFAGGYLDDSLDVFGRDAATGDLTFLESHRNGFGGETGLARVVELAVSADDQHIYGAGQNDDAIAVFMRDAHRADRPALADEPQPHGECLLERSDGGLRSGRAPRTTRAAAVSPATRSSSTTCR